MNLWEFQKKGFMVLNNDDKQWSDRIFHSRQAADDAIIERYKDTPDMLLEMARQLRVIFVECHYKENLSNN